PRLKNLGTTLPPLFFVAEAKVKSLTSGEHIAQAIGQMFACLKSLQHLRGALTNEREWILLVIMLDSNGHGAKYRHSLPVNPPESRGAWPNLVAGILLHWVSVGLLVLIAPLDTDTG
ncbi:hypothetical protein BJY52DRAFT_1117518, partial [Lactarius psammicola]